MRLATVTKKKPNTTISRPSSSLLPIPAPGTNGSTAITSTSTTDADEHDGDRQVALGARRSAPPASRRRSEREALA